MVFPLCSLLPIIAYHCSFKLVIVELSSNPKRVDDRLLRLHVTASRWYLWLVKDDVQLQPGAATLDIGIYPKWYVREAYEPWALSRLRFITSCWQRRKVELNVSKAVAWYPISVQRNQQ